MAGTGRVVQVIGPVIDVEFTGGLPAIYNAVRIVSEAKPGVEAIDVVAEVEQHLGENRVRTVAMKPTDPDAFYVLGKVLREQGENALARIALEKARGLAYTNDRRRRIDEMLQSLPPQ